MAINIYNHFSHLISSRKENLKQRTSPGIYNRTFFIIFNTIFCHWQGNQMAPLYYLIFENQSFNPSPCQHFEIIIDSGASTSYTNNLSDFVSNVKSIPGIPINGIANQLTATAIGTVNWFVDGDNGNPATIEVHAMYVPDLPIRFLSPQLLHQTSPSNSNSCSTRSHTGTIRWHLHTKTIHHNRQNNLPILLARNHTASIEQQALYCAFT